MRLGLKMGLLLMACVAAAPCHAARVTPMSVDLAPAGRDSTARIEFTNTEDRELPVEIRMYRGVISETGELTLEPADDQFLAFPPQVLMQPNTQQIFRVQYLPGEPLTRSEIFYAGISQIPVQLDPAVSKIQMVMRFNVLVNVVPDGAQPQAAVSWSRPATRAAPAEQAPAPETTPVPETTPEATAEMPENPADQTAASTAATPIAEAPAAPPAEQGVEVRVENSGDKYFAAGRVDWTITGTTAAGQPFTRSFTPSQIGSEIGMGVVPPGGARVFFVKLDDTLADGTIAVTIGS